MPTLFAIPKPFRGHNKVIQRNAIRSWTLLGPTFKIILFGDDEGTAETATEFGVCHGPDVERNEYGTPLMDDLFEKGESLAIDDLMCYVNSDIILMGDFARAVEYVAKRQHPRPFMMAGRRWSIVMDEPLDFKAGWEEQLRAYAIQSGNLYPPCGVDYWVFSRGLYENIPPFAIGRMSADNWFLHRAVSLGASLIDATEVVVAVHQGHDYSHISPKGRRRADLIEAPNRNGTSSWLAGCMA